MHLRLVVVLILSLSCAALPLEGRTTPSTETPPALLTPATQEQPTSASPAAPTSPEEQQVPPTPTPQSPSEPLLTPSPTATSVEVTPPTKSTEADATSKKIRATTSRDQPRLNTKKGSKIRTLSPFIAGAIIEARPFGHPLPIHRRIFARWQPGAQATAFPPLLIGIQASYANPAPEEAEPQITIKSVLTQKITQHDEKQQSSDTLDMLASLVELQKSIKIQIAVTGKKLKASVSEAEKQSLQEELTKLDKQLSETNTDFERIATGVKPEIFVEQAEKVKFIWKDELATLLEPTIKELKQLTAHARQKSALKESIAEYENQLATTRRAVEHLNGLINEAKHPKIKNYLSELLPAWQNMEKRVSNKLDLGQRELTKLENKEGSVLESSSNSMREFFRNRGLYLLIACSAFIAILLAGRLLARLLFFVLPGAKKEQRPMHVRILDIFLQALSSVLAVCGLVFVFYTAEDWFLLSATLILFLGIAWTVRQTLPKMWQQVRLILNMGAIREGERVLYQGVSWRVEAINVFCKLYNPALAIHLRIPIENMIGLVSRPYHIDEPWFPCKKGDWVSIDNYAFVKVASLSHEQVELVELGSRHIVYQTKDFLAKSPANLSRNFSLRVVFGLPYALQASITTTVLETLHAFIERKIKENGYAQDCLSLTVDFLQAGASSLDVAVMADFKGERAPAYRRLERALNTWCVECCNANNWEIPFPQMAVHLPERNQATEISN
jgi:hypothetical protein